MAGLKGATGLTRRRGLDEQSRLVWVLSRPAIISIDTIIKEMMWVDYKTSEQHISTKHVHASTLSRNQNDINTLKAFCKSRYLLDYSAISKVDMNIKNIATGLMAPSIVNITDVYNIGCKILDDMIGKLPFYTPLKINAGYSNTIKYW